MGSPSAINWSLRPTYTPQQLEQYFDRISLPQQYRASAVVKTGANLDDEGALALLRVLQRYQVASVPFENLNLHYAVHRGITIDPQGLFDKIVDPQSHRGGYCMENSTLFGTVLRSLGYEVTSVGGRVNEAAQPMSASRNWKGPKFDGWNHMVNIVTIGKQKYLIDVGFGSNGPHQPVPLIQNYEFRNVGEQSGRLISGAIAQHTNKDQLLWHYEIRNGTGAWTPAYCFTETEFLPEDFTIINYFMSTSRESWFTFHVVCVRMLLDGDGEKIIGELTLFNNQLKRRLGATSEVLETFSSEQERVAALEKFFHIPISPADQASIRHTISEIL
ncbi:putative N-acetyltransferase family protein [Aspergillus heteromorphus CBS 117.55]|uniref:Putative N-acetyltransferase family protein n=1 Tax=Aspergillus heteromorphus CBS 117.55 TaxID=1448321 RepID=A0A317X0V7_9EURO|nr:putative N-acetyltransferase family protein [Aspergillus heteromorphus CBS 117.55]PWY92299.1 putative N-acetyltransferase family protein [Aspergillus heteromorphus CBS 117.55]